MSTWFKSHKVQDTAQNYDDLEVLYRFNIDEDGIPIVITECFVPDHDHWYTEITSFQTRGSACDFVKMTTSIAAADWLDRIIEQDGLIHNDK